MPRARPAPPPVERLVLHRRAIGAGRGQRPVDHPDVRLLAGLQSSRHAGLGLTTQQLVEQLAPGADLHLQVLHLHRDRIEGHRLLPGTLELLLERALAPPRGLQVGGRGAPHRRDLGGDDVAQALTLLGDPRLEGDHQRVVLLVDHQLGLVVPLENHQVAPRLVDQRRRVDLGGGFGRRAGQLVVARLDLDPVGDRLGVAPVELGDPLDDLVRFRVEVDDVDVAADLLQLLLLVVDLLLEGVDLLIDEGGGLADELGAALDAPVDEGVGDAVDDAGRQLRIAALELDGDELGALDRRHVQTGLDLAGERRQQPVVRLGAARRRSG